MNKNLPLYASFFALGFYALVVQVLDVREFLVVFHGNELTIGLILGAWLFGIALGAFLFYLLNKRSAVNPVIIFSLAFLLLCSLLPCQIALIRNTRAIFAVPFGEYAPFSVIFYACFLFAAPPGMLIGILFPSACRLHSTVSGRDSSPHSISTVYIWEAAGSLVAGILFTFVFAPFFKPFFILAVSNTFAVLSVIMVLFSFPNATARGNVFLLKIVSFIVLFASGIAFLAVSDTMEKYLRLSTWHYSSENKTSNISIISRETKYGNIILETSGQNNLYSNGSYVTSFPQTETGALYLQAMVFMAETPSPKNVLLIGNGYPDLILQMLKFPLERLDYVQLDPGIVRLVNENLPDGYLAALNDPRLHIHYEDGRHFVKNSRKSYDLVILEVPEPHTAALNRFFTTNFFIELKRILSEAGTAFLSAPVSINAKSDELINYQASIYDSLTAVFEYTAPLPPNLLPQGYFMAESQPGNFSFDMEQLSQRYCKLKIDGPLVPQDAETAKQVLSQAIPIEMFAQCRMNLNKPRMVFINSDSSPITYFFNLLRWDRISGRPQGSIFQKLTGFRLWHVMVILWVAFFAMVFMKAGFKGRGKGADVPQLEKKNSGVVLYAVFAAGMAGMAGEIVMIFAFQNAFGYIYGMLGLVIAMFMAGLALGAWGAVRIMPGNKEKTFSMLLKVEFATAIFCLALPVLVRYPHQLLPDIVAQGVYLLLAVLGGALTGAVYPSASAVLAGDTGAIAGLIDTVDHAGAFLGALLAGVLFVPLFGISGTCLVMAQLNLFGIILLFFTVETQKEAAG